jgi:hypothetical protein
LLVVPVLAHPISTIVQTTHNEILINM